MSGGRAEVLGLVTALTGLLLLIAAAAKDCWRQGAKDQLTSVSLSSRCRGLWGECVHDDLVGVRTCDVTVSYMEDLPADLLAMRLSLVGMSLLSVLSVLVLIPALRCTTLVPSVPAQAQLMWISSALCLCGGVCGAVGLLWYGVETHIRYKQEAALGRPGITFELGPSYWLTLSGVFAALTSATLAVLSVCDAGDDIGRQQRATHGENPVLPQSNSNYKTYI